MSQFTQFVNNDSIGLLSFLGSYITANNLIVTGDGREYLISGSYTNYQSKYSKLYSITPNNCINDAVETPNSAVDAKPVGNPYAVDGHGGAGGDFQFPYYLTWYKIGSTYFRSWHGTQASNHIGTLNWLFQSTTDITATPTNTLMSASGLTAYDSIKSDISGSDKIYHTYNNGTNTIISSYNSSSLSDDQTAAYTSPYYLAASSSLLVAIRSTAQNAGSGAIYTSTDGSSWTARTGDINKTISFFFWSEPISAFVLITSAGEIYTTTDGYQFTAQTAPSGMPTSVATPNYKLSAFYDSSATATLCSLGDTGGGQWRSLILRVTSGPTFEVIDIYKSSPQAGWSMMQNGINYDGPLSIDYDGSQFVASPTFISGTNASTTTGDVGRQCPAVSSDNGSTWTSKPQKAAITYGEIYGQNIDRSIHKASFLGGTEWIVEMSGYYNGGSNRAGVLPFQFDDRYAGTGDPQFVGALVSITSYSFTTTTAYAYSTPRMYLRIF